MTSSQANDDVVQHVVDAITTAHPEHDAATVADIARVEYGKLEDAPIQDYVEVLTEHATKQRLRDR